MNEPRLRQPISLVLLEIVVMLGLLAGWISVIGITANTLFDGVYYVEVELVVPVADQVATGTHTLGRSDTASARLLESSYTLRLDDTAPLPFFGIRLIKILTLASALLALHQLDRILRMARAEHPFTLINARRCRRIGYLMTISWLLGLVQVLITKPLVDSATVEARYGLAMWSFPSIDFTALLLAFCGFCAGAVLRYGADLERERALTI